MNIGTTLIYIRNEKQVTQRELSQRTGLAASYLSRIENRRLEPRPRTLRKIADALGVPVGRFFEETPGQRSKAGCVITFSGSCIMDLVRSGRGRVPRAVAESYTPQQIQLLRMANYLVQSREARVLDALDLLFTSLLASAGDKRRLAPPAPASGAETKPAGG